MGYVLTYAPEGADPRVFDFAPERLMNVETEVIERHTGLAFGEAMDAFMHGNMTAIHAFLFVFLKRSTPTLRHGDVQFCLADIDIEVDEEQQREYLAQMDARTDLTPEQINAREDLRAVLDGSPKEEPVPDPTSD